MRCWQALRRWALNDALPVYLVGGPVRDVLLGAPIKDLDFVLVGDAPTLARRLAVELKGKVVTHPSFGTATVVLEDSRIDMVTARREAYPRPGALPQVSPGSIEDDLARRDFSINAMALPLFQDRPGIVDQHDGLADLAAGAVRILHRDSFVDDPTRVLRAVRYEQRLAFRLAPDTETRLREALAGGYLDAVSGDRLRHELERILEEREPWKVLARVAELGVLSAIHPAWKDSGVLSKSEPDQFSPTGLESHLVYVSALVYHLSPVDGEGVIQRLNLPHSWAGMVRDTIELRRREAELSNEALRPSQVYYLLEGLSREAVLAVSRLTPSVPVRLRLDQFLDQLAEVRPLLNGHDLLSLGVPAGPLLGRVLRQLQEARLDGLVATEADEMRLVRKILGNPGGDVH